MSKQKREFYYNETIYILTNVYCIISCNIYTILNDIIFGYRIFRYNVILQIFNGVASDSKHNLRK